MRTRTGQSVKALSDSMMQAVQAANMRNVLSVLGLTHFGVFVLYVVFITMLLFSVLFLIWAVRSESNRRFLYLNTLFMTSITAMAYLTMATGHGICVLRKVDGSWHFSNPLFANPVPPCLPPPLPPPLPPLLPPLLAPRLPPLRTPPGSSPALLPAFCADLFCSLGLP